MPKLWSRWSTWLLIVSASALVQGATIVASSSSSAGVARATVLPHMSGNEMIEKSALICRARAVEVDPGAYDVGTNEAFTFIRFELVEVIMGDWKEPFIDFYARGGFMPNGNLRVAIGVPLFSPGETYLLFIKAGAYYITPFVNWSMSVFRESNVQGNVIFVTNEGMSVRGFDQGGFLVGNKVAESEKLAFWRRLGWAGVEAAAQQESLTFAESSSSETRASEEPASADAVIASIKQRIVQLGTASQNWGSTIYSRPMQLPAVF